MQRRTDKRPGEPKRRRNRAGNSVFRMLERAQAFTARMDYAIYPAARASFTAAHAFENDRDAQLTFQGR